MHTHTQSDNDEFNKTLPANFKFRQVMMQSPTRSSPIRSVAHSTKHRSTTIQRRHPVAPGSKPSLSRFKKNTLGKSDPALTRNVSMRGEKERGREKGEGRNGRREKREEGKGRRGKGGGGKEGEGRRERGGGRRRRKERGRGEVGGEREKDRWERLREKGVGKGDVERRTAGLFVCEHIDWQLFFVH